MAVGRDSCVETSWGHIDTHIKRKELKWKERGERAVQKTDK